MVLTIIAIVIAALLLVYLLVAYLMAGSVIHLNRQPVPKTPRDYGMDFEGIEFQAADGVNLRGWLIPGADNKLVVMTHVGGLTRYGSTTQYKSLTKLSTRRCSSSRRPGTSTRRATGC